VIIDRPLGSKHPEHDIIYPVNYGYTKQYLSRDGDFLDVYVLGIFKPIKRFKGRCIAVIRRKDDEDKLVVAPFGKMYTKEQIEALLEFQERWFEHEVIALEKREFFSR